VFTIVQGIPLCGATHVMATLAKLEKKEVFSDLPLLYEHKTIDFGEVDKVKNSIIVLDYPVEVINNSPEIGDKKKNLLIAVLQSNYLGNVIYMTISSMFPIDNRFNLFCDYFIFCYPISNGVVRFDVNDLKNGSGARQLQLNVFAKERVLSYMPFQQGEK